MLTAIGLIIAALGVVGGITKFQPREPSRADSNAFLHLYYSEVVAGDTRSAWDTRLDETFRRNFFYIKSRTYKHYADYWNSVDRVELDNVGSMSGYDIEAELTYHLRSGRRARELTRFTVYCPRWTALTLVGCSPENMVIHDVRVIRQLPVQQG